MNEEDEAFEEMALKQGHWQHTSGWRKKQIMESQAFPNPHRTDITGMSLRDYFAAKAMQGLIVCAKNHGDIPHDWCAVDAYRYADAMLKARES
jgi:hypothetical protein